MLNFSFFGIFLLVTFYASTTAMPIDDEAAEKRYAGNMYMGFGKRSTVPVVFGLGKRADASGFSQFHMGLGKRANEFNDAELYELLPEDNFDSQKRYDMSQFHMGFGKRSLNDAMKRFSNNQFHMGLGKRFVVDFPGKLSYEITKRKVFIWALGNVPLKMLNNLDGRDLFMYLCHPSRLAMLFEHAIDLRDVCPM